MIWALLRSTLAVLSMIPQVGSGRALADLSATPGGVITAPSPQAFVYHAAAVAALLLVDLRINNERILLANLGFGRRVVVLPALAVVVVLEAALTILLRL